jgi:hypothetical protein
MNFNYYKLRKLSHERMRDRLQEAERDRLIRLASSTEGKSYGVIGVMEKIKDTILNLFRLKDTPHLNSTRRTGSLKESESSG